ncbi:50S ribosomal protein L5 [Candidatus Dojkabacteria bacterium]|uniref:Large ribosomal subunit protein uL5 n=1 Tax=Candidatus Dojkabacteria bacterium TaxID=2099670 RepID=A0A955L962_9BACT|nr:50S ribosomal protein L5 [Candidatus Dojkabacteria bacterium]
MDLKSNLKKEYSDKYKLELLKELGLDNIMSVPKVEKIVINTGLGEAKNNGSLIDAMVEDIANITGQSPVVTKAKTSVSNFKIREGMPIGVMVTLRGIKMWFFLEKLIHIVLPRVKDFRGVSPKSFDGNGNYNFGLKDQFVFPEIDSSKVTRPQGIQITISTSATNDDHARALLSKLQFPFVKQEN